MTQSRLQALTTRWHWLKYFRLGNSIGGLSAEAVACNLRIMLSDDSQYYLDRAAEYRRLAVESLEKDVAVAKLALRHKAAKHRAITNRKIPS